MRPVQLLTIVTTLGALTAQPAAAGEVWDDMKALFSIAGNCPIKCATFLGLGMKCGFIGIGTLSATNGDACICDNWAGDDDYSV
ncbi:hypothetical protein JCM8097_006501 [Rhodosporidiobolus ruineniae]